MTDKFLTHLWRPVATLLAVYFVLLGMSYLDTPQELDITQIGPLYVSDHSDHVRAAFSFLLAIVLFAFAIDPNIYHKLRSRLW